MPILSLFPSSGTASLEQQIAAVVASMETHTSNTTVHITADERSAWNAKASGTHTHGMADVTGLVTALAGKAASDHSHDGRYYTETEMNDKLAKKSDTDHVHKQADVTGLVTALADKAPLSHTHDDRYYTEDEIDEKLSAIPVRMLEGTDDNPINLTTLTETGTYYISGTTTETSDEVGLLKTLKLPLYVYAAYVTSETGSATRVIQTYIVSPDLASVSREVSPALSAWSTQVSSQEGHDHDNRYYTEDEIDEKLVVKHLVGTTENPIDLMTITETGTYYISGPITETNTEVAEAIGTEHLPLYVYTETTHDELTDTTTTDITQIVFGMLDSGIFYRTLPNATEWSVDRLSLSGHSHTISDIPTLSTQLNLKANLSVLNAHKGNNTIHLTGDDRTKLSGMCNVTTGSFVGASSAELTFDFEPSLLIVVADTFSGNSSMAWKSIMMITQSAKYVFGHLTTNSVSIQMKVATGSFLSGKTATFSPFQGSNQATYRYVAFGA